MQAPTTLDPCLPASLVPIPETTVAPTTTEAPTTTVAPASSDDSEGSLRWVVLGLVAVAGALAAVTVLYWKHTRPGDDLLPIDHTGTASGVNTGQVAALIGVPGAAAAFADDPDPTIVGMPAGVGGGDLPTYESVYGDTPYSGGTTGAAGALLAAGAPAGDEAFEYVEVDEAEVDAADGYEYLEVEVEVDDDDDEVTDTR